MCKLGSENAALCCIQLVTLLSNHSHEALRVIELAVGVDDLGPRLEGQPATRADQVLHVGHA